MIDMETGYVINRAVALSGFGSVKFVVQDGIDEIFRTTNYSELVDFIFGKDYNVLILWPMHGQDLVHSSQFFA